MRVEQGAARVVALPVQPHLSKVGRDHRGREHDPPGPIAGVHPPSVQSADSSHHLAWVKYPCACKAARATAAGYTVPPARSGHPRAARGRARSARKRDETLRFLLGEPSPGRAEGDPRAACTRQAPPARSHSAAIRRNGLRTTTRRRSSRPSGATATPVTHAACGRSPRPSTRQSRASARARPGSPSACFPKLPLGRACVSSR